MNNALRQVSSPILLVAAYGRSYPTKEAAIAAWESGKDFQIVSAGIRGAYYRGPYCSIRDLPVMIEQHPSGIYISYKHGVIKLI